MAITSSTQLPSAMPATEAEVVHSSCVLQKWLFGLVPIIAGLDKFTNLLARWEDYLNPMIPNTLHLAPHTFMLGVGVIEIVAGIIVFAKPRFGGFLVMAWLIAIAFQLILWGRFLDVAVRDLVMALAGALPLARLARFEQPRATQS